jgi:FMN reductase
VAQPDIGNGSVGLPFVSLNDDYRLTSASMYDKVKLILHCSHVIDCWDPEETIPMTRPKLIVAVGGTLRALSSTEAAMRRVLNYAEKQGAQTRIFTGTMLNLPPYAPDNVSTAPEVKDLIETLRSASAIVLGSPGYHGGISGLVKNALDYTEEMAKDPAPYFSGKPIGCIATGFGWQGCNSTLHALRSVVHALRGWPTPLGIAFNSMNPAFGPNGECLVSQLDDQFRLMAEQLLQFGRD